MCNFFFIEILVPLLQLKSEHQVLLTNKGFTNDTLIQKWKSWNLAQVKLRAKCKNKLKQTTTHKLTFSNKGSRFWNKSQNKKSYTSGWCYNAHSSSPSSITCQSKTKTSGNETTISLIAYLDGSYNQNLYHHAIRSMAGLYHP